MKKKVLSAIVCAAMVFSMTACGLQSPNTGGSSGGTTNAASTSNASATSDAAEAETTTEAASSGDSATEPVGPAVTLVYAEVNPLEGTIVGQTATAFKDKVEELSGGSITIDIQANGVLGAESDVLDTDKLRRRKIQSFICTVHIRKQRSFLEFRYIRSGTGIFT